MCDGVHSCLRIHVNALPTVYLVYTILPSPSGSGDLEDIWTESLAPWGRHGMTLELS